jgi:AraC-like DNA-binding protein
MRDPVTRGGLSLVPTAAKAGGERSTEPYATAHDAAFTLVRLLLNKGIESAEIARHTGIAIDALDDPDARIPLSQFERLWVYTAQQLRNPAIALEIHDRYPENRMHFVAHLGMRCATMREAIEHWRKYAFLVSEADSVDYAQTGQMARFIYKCLDMRYASHWFAEHFLAMALFYARTFTGEPLKVKRATFTHADPGYREIYERVFEAEIEFNAAENALSFDSSYLDMSFETADPYLRHFLAGKADELLARLEPEARTDNRVAQVLSILLAKGEELTLERVAQAMQLPVRRVRMLLEAEGRSFREILSEVRREAAARYLRQGLTISQTAYLLGFSEPSALQHAFKRWYNAPVGSFRDQPGTTPGKRNLRAR